MNVDDNMMKIIIPQFFLHLHYVFRHLHRLQLLLNLISNSSHIHEIFHAIKKCGSMQAITMCTDRFNNITSQLHETWRKQEVNYL